MNEENEKLSIWKNLINLKVLLGAAHFAIYKIVNNNEKIDRYDCDEHYCWRPRYYTEHIYDYPTVPTETDTFWCERRNTDTPLCYYISVISHRKCVGYLDFNSESSDENSDKCVSIKFVHQWPVVGRVLYAVYSDPITFEEFHVWRSNVCPYSILARYVIVIYLLLFSLSLYYFGLYVYFDFICENFKIWSWNSEY